MSKIGYVCLTLCLGGMLCLKLNSKGENLEIIFSNMNLFVESSN